MDNEREHPGMKTVMELINFIQTKKESETHVFIDSNKFKLDIPISDKDVMCMKVIKLINDEYGQHTVGDGIEMLLDTIWWMQTILIAFPERKNNE